MSYGPFDFPFGLMYNYVVPGPKKIFPNVAPSDCEDFTTEDTLDDNRIFVQKNGRACCVRDISILRISEVKMGFTFIGDNGVFYKPNGKTTIDDSPGMYGNEIVAYVKPEHEQLYRPLSPSDLLLKHSEGSADHDLGLKIEIGGKLYTVDEIIADKTLHIKEDSFDDVLEYFASIKGDVSVPMVTIDSVAEPRQEKDQDGN